MSDNWIILIPTDPDFIPDQERQGEALSYFWEIAPNSDQIDVEASDGIRFIDCGANLTKIRCPSCRKEIDIEWWQDHMDAEFDQEDPLRPVALPCCKAMHGLNELHYHWPQGFARFSIEAMNPQIPDLSASQQQIFESILGCRTIKILQHI